MSRDLQTSEQYLWNINKLLKRYPRKTRKCCSTWKNTSGRFPHMATHCLWWNMRLSTGKVRGATPSPNSRLLMLRKRAFTFIATFRDTSSTSSAPETRLPNPGTTSSAANTSTTFNRKNTS